MLIRRRFLLGPKRQLPGVALATVLALVACSDTQEALYLNRAAAEQAGALKASWLPQWLPEQASSLRIATVRAERSFMLQFAYPPDTELPLPDTCKKVTPAKAPGPPLWRNWWPHDVPPGATTTPRHSFMRCKDYYVAYSTSQGDAYVWMKR